MASLSGCLFTSPFHGQSFTDRTTPVPIQAWTTSPNQVVKVQCALSTRFGPTWINPNPDWIQVANLSSSSKGMLDPLGNTVFSAGIEMTLPEGCWELNNSNGIYYTAIRVFTGNTVFYSFQEDGLECLGKMIGQTTNWFGWNNNCINKTSGGSKAPYVVIRTE